MFVILKKPKTRNPSFHLSVNPLLLRFCASKPVPSSVIPIPRVRSQEKNGSCEHSRTLTDTPINKTHSLQCCSSIAARRKERAGKKKKRETHMKAQTLCGDGGGTSCTDSCSPVDLAHQAPLSTGVPTLEWVAISFPTGYSQPSNGTWVSSTAGRSFTTEPRGKPIDTTLINNIQ